ncbi:hypothetical protein J8F10_09440 [Gemmata sp. G18]|uniref:Uncharacterized protein n=1 Tax=Gemmata palustris TaxID=2822762 RepID=A0ABS5BP99_9BACT|nr:hypothetical protein [Gemmata palustris]MBP3955504.1 hypothetical protein [Gemmata palustris]
MATQSRWLIALTGIVIGALGTLLMTDDRTNRVHAQPVPASPPAAVPPWVANAAPAPAGPVGRYQISAWGADIRGGPNHGAFIIDTQTGEVFHVDQSTKPRSLGTVEKK